MVSKAQAAATQPALVEVVLNKPHTHNGEPFAAGDKLKVTADQQAWLSKQGVIGSQQKEQNNG